MSDLQCPATILLIPSDSLGSSECARALEGRRLAGIFVDPQAADADTLAAVSGVADATSCELQYLEALVDGARFRQTLDELSDGYRGETVAVVASSAVLQSSQPLELSIDSSGWTVVRSFAAT